MVFGLSADFDQTESSVGVERGGGEHLEESGLADVVGTGAGDEEAVGTKHLEGAEIEFLVAADGCIEIALALGEGGRVENDGVVMAIGGGVVLKQVEGVGLDPFDFFSLEQRLVEGGVVVCDFESGTRAVDPCDLRATRGEMEGEA